MLWSFKSSKKRTLLILWAARLVETYTKTSFDKIEGFWKSKLGSFCELPAGWKCTQRPLLTKLRAFEIWNICLCQKFVLKHSCQQTIFLKDWSRKCVSTFFLQILHFTFCNIDLSRLTFSSPKKVQKQSFLQAQRAQEMQLLKDSQSNLATSLLHHWLKQHNLFANWSVEVFETSQGILFHKPCGHKKRSFWKFQRQSWQFKCFIIDWCITIYSQIEALKSPKRLKIVFSTSPVGTRNTAFERSTANLGILIVASLIGATHFFLKLKLWSSQKLPNHSFSQAQWVQKTHLLKVPTLILAI